MRPTTRIQSSSFRSIRLRASTSAGRNSLPVMDARGIAPDDPNRQVQTIAAPALLPPPAVVPVPSRIPNVGFR